MGVERSSFRHYSARSTTINMLVPVEAVTSVHSVSHNLIGPDCSSKLRIRLNNSVYNYLIMGKKITLFEVIINPLSLSPTPLPHPPPPPCVATFSKLHCKRLFHCTFITYICSYKKLILWS